MNKKYESWLIKTSQLWKINISLILCVLGFLLMCLGFLTHNASIAPTFAKVGIIDINIESAFGLTMLVVFYFVFSVKCPACKKRPIYHLLKTEKLSSYLNTIMTFENCPICGYAADKRENMSEQVCKHGRWYVMKLF
jgi:hypothetical protein